jgi:hypothetical protein
MNKYYSCDLRKSKYPVRRVFRGPSLRTADIDGNPFCLEMIRWDRARDTVSLCLGYSALCCPGGGEQPGGKAEPGRGTVL